MKIGVDQLLGLARECLAMMTVAMPKTSLAGRSTRTEATTCAWP